MADPKARVNLNQKDVLLSNDETWCSSVLDKLNLMRNKNRLCDATLEVSSEGFEEKTLFPVHACVLAASSDLFSGMFSKHVAKRKVQLDRFEVDIVEACLNYMYGKDLQVPLNKVSLLRDSAKRLGLRTLTARCDEALEVLKINQSSPTKSIRVTDIKGDGNKENQGSDDESIMINQDQLFGFEHEADTPESVKITRNVKEGLRTEDYSDSYKWQGNPAAPIDSSISKDARDISTDDNKQGSGQKGTQPGELKTNKALGSGKTPKVMVSIFSQPIDSHIDISPQKDENREIGARKMKTPLKEKPAAKKRKLSASFEDLDFIQEVHLVGETTSMATKEAKLSGKVHHVCKLCGDTFPKRQQWSEHQLNEHGRSFECRFCDQAFKKRHHWRIHEQRHTGEKNYDCKYCEFQAVTAAEVKYHEEMEHLEQEHVCPICDKVFYSQKSLIKHRDIHTKIFNCEYCEYTAKKKSNVSRHVLKEHFPEKLETLECPMCDKIYNFKVQLDQHLMLKHEAKSAANFRNVRKVGSESFPEIDELTDNGSDNESNYEFEDSELILGDSIDNSEESSQEEYVDGEMAEIKPEKPIDRDDGGDGATEIIFEDM